VSAPPGRPTLCATPGCTEPLPTPGRRGRPRLYCSPQCRTAGASRSGTLRVEVDHELDEDGGRPTGRVWLVKMRRGRREVIVASELGRPSADHLAGQIAALIGPRRRAEGGAME
jgi:hypothetical protein